MYELKELCKMSQEDIKQAALMLPGAVELEGSNEGESSVMVPGVVPYVLLAHMDTVYTGEPGTIIEEHGKLSVPKGSEAGIGGDDRCGIYMLFQAATWEFAPTLLFCQNEESCGQGSSRGLDEMDWSKQKCFIEVDGPGFGLFYCDTSTSTTELNNFLKDELGLKQEHTSYNDIKEICKSGNPPGVTLGAAYYGQHNARNEWISTVGVECQLKVIKQITAVIDRLEWSVLPEKPAYQDHGYGYYGSYGSYMGGKSYGASGKYNPTPDRYDYVNDRAKPTPKKVHAPLGVIKGQIQEKWDNLRGRFGTNNDDWYEDDLCDGQYDNYVFPKSKKNYDLMLDMNGEYYYQERVVIPTTSQIVRCNDCVGDNDTPMGPKCKYFDECLELGECPYTEGSCFACDMQKICEETSLAVDK